MVLKGELSTLNVLFRAYLNQFSFSFFEDRALYTTCFFYQARESSLVNKQVALYIDLFMVLFHGSSQQAKRHIYMLLKLSSISD